jgi:hypothetical protein
VLVAQANDRMQANRLLTPAGSSARDSLVEARKLDPTDPNVGQSIRELTGMLTDEARKSLGEGKLDEAQSSKLRHCGPPARLRGSGPGDGRTLACRCDQGGVRCGGCAPCTGVRGPQRRIDGGRHQAAHDRGQAHRSAG